MKSVQFGAGRRTRGANTQEELGLAFEEYQNGTFIRSKVS
jgi:hypothetical protein